MNDRVGWPHSLSGRFEEEINPLPLLGIELWFLERPSRHYIDYSITSIREKQNFITMSRHSFAGGYSTQKEDATRLINYARGSPSIRLRRAVSHYSTKSCFSRKNQPSPKQQQLLYSTLSICLFRRNPTQSRLHLQQNNGFRYVFSTSMYKYSHKLSNTCLPQF